MPPYSQKNFLKAIIFDMDGVITMTMPYHVRAWSRIFIGEGINVDPSEIYAREGQRGIVGILEIFARYGRPLSPRHAKKLLAKKEMLFKQIVRTRFVPGAKGFIKKYHKKSIKLAVVTGTSRHELEQILPTALMHKFDVIITGNDVKNGKPHPEPYRKALQMLKVKKAEAFVIENAPYGITSAIKAGLVCAALETSLPKAFLKDATEIVVDYRGLEKFIGQHYSL